MQVPSLGGCRLLRCRAKIGAGSVSQQLRRSVSWQRAQQLLRITRSCATGTGCSRASCRQAGRRSPMAAAAALAAVGLGVEGPL